MTASAAMRIFAGLALFTRTLTIHPHDSDTLVTVHITAGNFTWRQFLKVQFLDARDRGGRFSRIITDVASTAVDFGSGLNYKCKSNCKHRFGDWRESNYECELWTQRR